jgi:hypothetical protein
MKIIAIAIVFASLNVFAHEHIVPKTSAQFDQMKALVGTWEGKTTMNGKEEPITLTYKTTSGGTALVETMGPGTPMEMTTVYANRGKDINVTHFCVAGNQPEMKLKSATDNTWAFEMDGTKGISNKKEMHMHGVKLTLAGNKLTQEWQNWTGGKQAETAVFEFTKKQ